MDKNTLLYKWLGTCLVLLSMVCLGARPVLGIQRDTFPAVGHHLPSIEFADLEGKKYNLAWNSPRPGTAVIFFFEPRCADCFKEMVFFNGLYGQAKDFGLDVYAVEASGLTVSETREALRKYRQIYGEPSFPVIADPDYALSSLFRIRRLPSSFLIERHGVVLSRGDRFDNRYAVNLTRKIERLLRVDRGLFSFALRELNIDSEAEENFEKALRSGPDRTGAGRQPNRLRAVGDVVPGFEFTDIHGARLRWIPTTENTSLTIVFFWGALCQPCIQEMAFLDEVYDSAHELGLEIIAVEASGLSPARTARVMERYRRFHPPPSYDIVPDPEYRIAAHFGVKGKLPQTFFISGSGRVTYHTGEFIQGHEEGLTGKIERALNLEFGSLQNTLTSVRNRDVSPFGVKEAPSIRIGLQRDETFRSNMMMGDTYYRAWEHAKALPHYLRCLELEPGHVSIRARVAKIYQRMGYLEKALAHWEVVLDLEPDNREALERIGSLRRQGVSDEGDI